LPELLLPLPLLPPDFDPPPEELPPDELPLFEPPDDPPLLLPLEPDFFLLSAIRNNPLVVMHDAFRSRRNLHRSITNILNCLLEYAG
jgi:hypothetical protein